MGSLSLAHNATYYAYACLLYATFDCLYITRHPKSIHGYKYLIAWDMESYARVHMHVYTRVYALKHAYVMPALTLVYLMHPENTITLVYTLTETFIAVRTC